MSVPWKARSFESAKPEGSEFVIGAVVKLTCGGVYMTVEGITRPPKEMEHVAICVHCVWFDGQGSLHRDTFRQDSLVEK